MEIIINIKDELYPLVPLLFPNFSIETELRKPEKFIVTRDIRKQSEILSIKSRFRSYVIISKVLFDEVWNEDVLAEKVLGFRKHWFSCRKRSLSELLKFEGYDFVVKAKEFMYFGEITDEEQGQIYELFSSFGEAKFSEMFLRMCETEPVMKIVASMNTFIFKVMSANEASTLFYRKKNIVLGEKLQRNYLRAFERFHSMPRSPYGLNFLQFYTDLVV